MQFMTTARRLAGSTPARLAGALTLAAALLTLAVPAASAHTAAGAAQAGHQAPAAEPVGYVRMAHLSPNTAAVDVYLYSLGKPASKPVLQHVSYGTVSPFQTVTPGVYAVAMRPAGAAASSTPLVSSSVSVVAGGSYTVAAIGSSSSLKLGVYPDPRTTPSGSALIQVIQASLQQNKVSVTAGSTKLASDLTLGNATKFVAAPAGTWALRATGPTQSANQQVTLTADTVHTIVVLDGQHGLSLDDLTNSAGSTVMPKAGVQTGFGGAAAQPGAPLMPWALAGVAGLALIVTGLALARRRHGHVS